MTLINIGELVKNLTPDLKEAHRGFPGGPLRVCGI